MSIETQWQLRTEVEAAEARWAEAMADFDAIYEDQQDEVSSILEGPDINLVPDPVIIRGAGNITVWVSHTAHILEFSNFDIDTSIHRFSLYT